MDFITIVSFLLYIVTFVAGFLLDIHPEKKAKARKIYVFWLYFFLCFGYMCGSDWNTYELDYTNGRGVDRYITEPISYFLFTALPKVLPDFWVFCGIAKCLYLYTLIRLLKCMTNKWLSSLALLMPFSLLFMLISNPLRYMMSLSFVNLALMWIVNNYCNDKKIKHLWFKVFALVLISACIQNTSAVFLLFLPLIMLYKSIWKANRIVIFILFIIVIVLTSEVSAISDLKNKINAYLTLMMGLRDYSSYYEYEDNSALFSLGNLFKVFFLFVVLFYRNKVVSKYNNGMMLYGVSVLALFFERFFLLIPTAFRWAIPFDYFYVVYFICCLTCHLAYARIILLYATFLLCKNLWFSYDLIPYSNSIPYILTGHKPYSERIHYNTDAYQRRTGKTIEEFVDYSY